MSRFDSLMKSYDPLILAHEMLLPIRGFQSRGSRLRRPLFGPSIHQSIGSSVSFVSFGALSFSLLLSESINSLTA